MTSNLLKRSVRAKVTLGVVLPMILILGVFTAIEHARHQATVLENLAQLASLSGKVIESDLRHAMLDSDFTEVRALLDTIGSSQEFKIVYVLDTSGKVIFAPDNKGVGIQLDNHQPTCQPCHHLPVEDRPLSVVVVADDGQRVFRSMQPIRNGPACTECHDADKPLLGLLLTDIPISPMEEALSADLRENILWWVGTIIVTVIVVNVVLNRFVFLRLKGLAAAIARLGQGKPSLLLSETQSDELGQVAIAFNAMAQQVKERDEENRALSDDLRRQHSQRGELLKGLITAQENERRRLARELHDELGQALTGLALHTELMERFICSDSAGAIAQLDQIRTLIKETTDQMYDLILDLRPSALDDMGLAVALRVYAERVLSGTGITFELDVEGQRERLRPTIETALYRIFQEALSNVVRHAEAKHVRIQLAQSGGYFEGEIADDGQGFDYETVRMDGHSPHGLGLLGIQERMVQCGGQLEIVSRRGNGTHITIRIPLMEDKIGD
jgi:signal transduction histidine kinase